MKSIFFFTFKEEETPDSILNDKYEAFLLRQLKKRIDESKILLICPYLPTKKFSNMKLTMKLAGFNLSLVNNRHMR